MKQLSTLSRIAILELVFLVSFTVTGSIAQEPQSPKPTRTNIVSPTPETQKSLPSEEPVSDRCIITIDAIRYDITDFRNIHSGGEIFTCNMDMSAIFWQQHDQAHLDQLVRYRM